MNHVARAIARWSSVWAVLSLLATGCFYAVHSTSGGRKEARRECLAVARSAGWTVIDLSEAKWLGAAMHEVMLTVEQNNVPRRTLRCVYDQRDRVAELTSPTGR